MPDFLVDACGSGWLISPSLLLSGFGAMVGELSANMLLRTPAAEET
jgi:hypothetical protein